MTDCSRCGDCCERIYLNADYDWLVRIAKAPAWHDDPQAWMDLGWTHDRYNGSRPNAEFIAAHWHPIPEEAGLRFRCDAFDPEARLCTAYRERPPVCSGFPWYGEPPNDGHGLPVRCTFWADVAEEKRPDEVRVALGARR